MPINKEEILLLSTEEKRLLAFELLDSIDEEFAGKLMPDWKRSIIEQRIANDKSNPSNVVSWSELRRKYFSK